MASLDETCLNIWNVSTWACVHSIKQYFTEVANPMFARLSWSPDGKYLSTPMGMIQKKHCAPVFARNKNFEQEFCFSHNEVLTVTVSFMVLL